MGAFAYSREEDTPAYDFPDQIDEQVKQDRADRIMELSYEQGASYNEAALGKVVTVLCEDFDPVSGVFFGRDASQAPEIDTKIYFRAPRKAVKAGDFVSVKLTDLMDYDLIGEKV